jgi:glycosyltransferase involved in cell wall biosynthesis
MKRHLLIVLRTCTVVNSASGTDRYIQVPKHQLVQRCVSSLVNSINQVTEYDVELVVLDDHSSPEAVADIKAIIGHCRHPAEFIPITDGSGNGWSMKRVYEQVEKRCKDLWYHVEDDYLHVPAAVNDMIASVDLFEANTGKMVAINPHDDVWRYTRQIYHSILLHGPHRHYRTVQHTTYTCLASRKLYDTYRDVFQSLVDLTIANQGWVEDRSINQIWSQEAVMLFSPIPGVAFHIMGEDGRDPYFNIDALWDSVPQLWMTK